MTNYENDIQAITKNGAEGELTKVSINNGEIENVNTTTLQSEANELNPLAEPVATGQKNIISVDEASSIASGNNVYINQDNKLMQIDYDTLATAILNKLSTQSFNSLNTSSKLVLDAINELNGKSWLLQGGTAIPENADMDTYTTPGNYYVISNTQAATLSNSPFENNAFILKVEYANGVTYPRQIFTEYSTGRKAIRFISSSGGSWSDWLYFSDDDTVQTNTESYVYTASGEYSADCNDITRPGLHKNIISSTAVNSPGFYAYILVLRYKGYSDENLTQVAFPYNSSDPIKTRYRYSGAWSEWI